MSLPSLELTLNVNEIEEEIYGALEQVLALETDKSASENAEQPLHQLGGGKSGFELNEICICRCQNENNHILF